MGGKTTREQRQRWLEKPGSRAKVRSKQRRYKRRAAVKAKARVASAAYRAAKGDAMLLSYARSRAEKKGLLFTLPLEWLAGRTTCELSGLPFIRGHKLYAASIDRIDNSQGYTPSNCRLILRGLNVFKNDATEAEMLHIIHAVAQRTGG